MLVSDYIIDNLIKLGVTDIWGIPGGVVFDYMYAAKRRERDINLHLSYHEQAAGFEAQGFAQASGKIGVCFATRGPGVTNVVTAITDAYYESVPVILFTAHANPYGKSKSRSEFDQEVNTNYFFKNITKKVVQIETTESFVRDFNDGIYRALEGRKGPVIFDILTSVLKSEIKCKTLKFPTCTISDSKINLILDSIIQSKRPIFLIGDGIKQAGAVTLFNKIVDKFKIPVISSRGAEDIIPKSKYYFGYVGSHGVRTANFIISKSDCVVCIGNRVSFPFNSNSFSPLFRTAKWIRIDIDNAELTREIPDSISINCDLNNLLKELNFAEIPSLDFSAWTDVCNKIKSKLNNLDNTEPVVKLTEILKFLSKKISYIASDVGNNEFWLSLAYLKSGINTNIIYSKSFGVLGSGLPKAIGCYYSTHKPVICVCGDQGFQFNIQELQVLIHEKIPVWIIVVNNQSSGMIKDAEQKKYTSLVQVNEENGYKSLDLKRISEAYGINYIDYNIDVQLNDLDENAPCIINMRINASVSLTPFLPAGRKCYDLEPKLDKSILEQIENL